MLLCNIAKVLSEKAILPYLLLIWGRIGEPLNNIVSLQKSCSPEMPSALFNRLPTEGGGR